MYVIIDAVGAYDNFHPYCVHAGTGVASEMLRELVRTGTESRRKKRALSCATRSHSAYSHMRKSSSHPFDALVERFAQILADRIAAALPASTRARNGHNGSAARVADGSAT
jgi:hypothetical protein